MLRRAEREVWGWVLEGEGWIGGLRRRYLGSMGGSLVVEGERAFWFGVRELYRAMRVRWSVVGS